MPNSSVSGVCAEGPPAAASTSPAQPSACAACARLKRPVLRMSATGTSQRTVRMILRGPERRPVVRESIPRQHPAQSHATRCPTLQRPARLARGLSARRACSRRALSVDETKSHLLRRTAGGGGTQARFQEDRRWAHGEDSPDGERRGERASPARTRVCEFDLLGEEPRDAPPVVLGRRHSPEPARGAHKRLKRNATALRPARGRCGRGAAAAQRGRPGPAGPHLVLRRSPLSKSATSRLASTTVSMLSSGA